MMRVRGRAKLLCVLFCAILLAACEDPTPTRRNTPTRTGVGISRTLPTATRRPTQTSTQKYPVCEGAAPPKLSVGLRAVVKWDAVNIRSAPEVPADHAANIVTVVHAGDTFPVVGGPECVYGGYWWLVRIDSGENGWVREASSNGVLISPANVTTAAQIPTRVPASPTRTRISPTLKPTPNPTQVPVNDAIPWYKAMEYIGQTKTVYGPVRTSKYAPNSNGQPTFLDVGEPYYGSDRFTIVIWGNNRSSFPTAPEDHYLEKSVCATGLIEEYKKHPEMEVKKPSQLKLCDPPMEFAAQCEGYSDWSSDVVDVFQTLGTLEYPPDDYMLKLRENPSKLNNYSSDFIRYWEWKVSGFSYPSIASRAQEELTGAVFLFTGAVRLYNDGDINGAQKELLKSSVIFSEFRDEWNNATDICSLYLYSSN